MKNKKSGYGLIFLIVICAALGYTITSRIIRSQVIEYSMLPKEVSLFLIDEPSEDTLYVNLPVTSKFKIAQLPVYTEAPTKEIIRGYIFHESKIR